MDSGKKGRPVSRDSPEQNARKTNASVAVLKGTEPVKKKDDKKAKKAADLKNKMAAAEKKGKKSAKGQNFEKAKVRKKKKSMLEQFFNSFGIGFGSVDLRDPRAIEAAQALNLTPGHLRKLKIKFDRIDIDGSGSIDSDEFFEAVGEQRSPLTDRLFALIDLDGSGTIEFDEYVRVMATYCMFTKDEILRFCFECFDVDSSGTIDEKEFIELCK